MQATVVTASGDILEASADSNPDLFWGIRGGGCNFGVVTEFIIKLHPQPNPVWFAHLVFLPNMLGPLVAAVEKWFTTADPKKEAGMLGFATSPGDHRPCVMFGALFNGTEAEGRQKFAEIIALGESSLKLTWNVNSQRRRPYPGERGRDALCSNQ